MAQQTKEQCQDFFADVAAVGMIQQFHIDYQTDRTGIADSELRTYETFGSLTAKEVGAFTYNVGFFLFRDRPIKEFELYRGIQITELYSFHMNQHLFKGCRECFEHLRTRRLLSSNKDDFLNEYLKMQEMGRELSGLDKAPLYTESFQDMRNLVFKFVSENLGEVNNEVVQRFNLISRSCHLETDYPDFTLLLSGGSRKSIQKFVTSYDGQHHTLMFCPFEEEPEAAAAALHIPTVEVLNTVWMAWRFLNSQGTPPK